jgi:pantoate--beta-alanine ligase
MITYESAEDLSLKIRHLQDKSLKVSFVPTMGGLHEGHLELMKLAQQKSDVVVVSIFVNPTQFGHNEDLNNYPRTLEKDIALLETLDIDILFTPSVEEIYPSNDLESYELGFLDTILCAKTRPGHFNGVAQVVNRLFDIVHPDIAVFGEKDYQQLMVIKLINKNRKDDIQVISHEIIREKDGLAMSTRNQYLSFDDRENAKKIYQNLLGIKTDFLRGIDLDSSIKKAKDNLSQFSKLDYLEARNSKDLTDIDNKTDEIILLCATYLGETRLIDNLIFRRKNV